MKPTYIIIHHSLTEDNKTVSWNDIRKYHTSWRYHGNIITVEEATKLKSQGIDDIEAPWRDIGYHYGIELINDNYEILVGRMMNAIGAHCVDGGMNSCSLGICVIGNFDIADVPLRQFNLLITLTRALREVLNIPAVNIKRHHDYAGYKSCPGNLFPWQTFLNAIR